MSESNEGVPIPVEAKKSKVELNEFGEIKGGKPAEAAPPAPVIDTDDLPENQGRRPIPNLNALRERFANSTPVDATKLPQASPTPKGPAK